MIESRIPRKIGEVLDLPEYELGESPVVRAKIVREATEEEYVVDSLADPNLSEDSRLRTHVTGALDRWWYEVEVD